MVDASSKKQDPNAPASTVKIPRKSKSGTSSKPGGDPENLSTTQRLLAEKRKRREDSDE